MSKKKVLTSAQLLIDSLLDDPSEGGPASPSGASEGGPPSPKAFPKRAVADGSRESSRREQRSREISREGAKKSSGATRVASRAEDKVLIVDLVEQAPAAANDELGADKTIAIPTSQHQGK